MHRRLQQFAIAATAGLVIFTASSCTRTTKAEAPPEVPTVAVAKASIEDLSHALVLTAEFKPFQEIDVMAKVAGYVRRSTSMWAIGLPQGSCWPLWRFRRWATT